MDFILQFDESADFQIMEKIPTDKWINSNELAKSIKESKDFLRFAQINESNLQMKQLSLMYAESPVPEASEPLTQWMAVAFVSQTNAAICYYNATNGNPLLCSVPPITSILHDNIISKHFPNPTKGKLTINTEINDKSTIIIYDANGNVVSKLEDTIPNNIILDLHNQQNGLYTVVIYSKDKMTSQKIILIK